MQFAREVADRVVVFDKMVDIIEIGLPDENFYQSKEWKDEVLFNQNH